MKTSMWSLWYLEIISTYVSKNSCGKMNRCSFLGYSNGSAVMVATLCWLGRGVMEARIGALRQQLRLLSKIM